MDLEKQMLLKKPTMFIFPYYKYYNHESPVVMKLIKDKCQNTLVFTNRVEEWVQNTGGETSIKLGKPLILSNNVLYFILEQESLATVLKPFGTVVFEDFCNSKDESFFKPGTKIEAVSKIFNQVKALKKNCFIMDNDCFMYMCNFTDEAKLYVSQTESSTPFPGSILFDFTNVYYF